MATVAKLMCPAPCGAVLSASPATIRKRDSVFTGVGVPEARPFVPARKSVRISSRQSGGSEIPGFSVRRATPLTLLDLLDEPSLWPARSQRRMQRGRENPVQSVNAPPRKMVFQETEDEYVFGINLPGMKREDIQVSVEGGKLIVAGTTVSEDITEDDNYKRQEWITTKFRHELVLPKDADPTQVRANVEDKKFLRLIAPKKGADGAVQVESIPVSFKHEPAPHASPAPAAAPRVPQEQKRQSSQLA